MAFRTERDPLGEVDVPADAYYGAQTERAVDNFPISGLRAPADLVTATILIKKSAAEANAALNRLEPEVARSIAASADEVVSGKLRDQFVVDVYQAGAGTSHNMNANEVLANRAGELLGEPRGTYRRVHPNDHVNMGQSTNDVFPTATRIALLMGAGPLVAAVGILLLLRADQHTSYLVDLLPALLVFSLGLSMTVAPLTATVLADADERDAGIASAINNAVARVAGLVGISVLGVVVASTLTSDTFAPDAESVHAFHLAIVACAVLVAAGGVAGAFGIANPRRSVEARTCPAGQLTGAPEPIGDSSA